MKKFIRVIECIILICILSNFMQTALAAEDSGYCGSSFWKYENGVLTISPSGSGVILNYDTDLQPWYYYRSSINRVVIEDGITVIGKEAFYGLYIKSIYIPQTVTKIDVGAFYNCNYLSSVTGGDSVSLIGNNAFGNTPWYNNLSGLKIVGNTVLKYGGNMPSNTEIVLPDNIKSIAPSAFYECVGLKSIKFPKGIESIGKNSFRGCSSLTEIFFPESLIEIGENSFGTCTSLSEVYLPSTISNIDSYAFYKCSNIQKLYVLNKECTITGTYAIPSAATIYGFESSTAETYAKKYSKKFMKLNNDGMPYEISSVAFNSNGNDTIDVTFNPHNLNTIDKIIILAIYDKNDKLIDTIIQPSSKMSGDIRFTVNQSYDSFKIFMWTSFDELIPLSNAY
ncbi:MAG: leucine-rich repeat domain-containing protein [Clostridiales bacterium]|nr:leucine-rich repeat domain-containing protein [Clostridiales bacterium]